jgi:hypothetical protein
MRNSCVGILIWFLEAFALVDFEARETGTIVDKRTVIKAVCTEAQNVVFKI